MYLDFLTSKQRIEKPEPHTIYRTLARQAGICAGAAAPPVSSHSKLGGTRARWALRARHAGVGKLPLPCRARSAHRRIRSQPRARSATHLGHPEHRANVILKEALFARTSRHGAALPDLPDLGGRRWRTLRFQ